MHSREKQTEPITDAENNKHALLIVHANSPGSSFLVNISLSVKLGCGDANEDSQDEPCIDVGGATRVDDLVTTSFRILSASFQWVP